MDEPVQGNIRIWFGEKSWPVWYYDELPEGVRQAKERDLYNGRPVLYKVSIGPFEGKWGSEFVRPSNREALKALVADGSVYVK